MVAMNYYEEHVKTCIESGVDLIISGAGLPTSLPKLIKGSSVKIAPIVSSSKALNTILKIWDRKDNITADMVIVEGPKAGGHLGYHPDELDNVGNIDYDSEFIKILNIAKNYGHKFNKEIPVIAAGGIFTGDDVLKYINLGAHGVQVGTKFVATKECDASYEYKMAYVNSTENDIKIIKSPVGMPGRTIANNFIKSVNNNKIVKCYNCLLPCNPNNTPYCISKALINAVRGDVKNGLIFCGSNVYKINSITTVSQVIDELISKL